MFVITRNFFRLLRAGAFGQQDKVEPMSVWKWEKTFRLSMIHHVEAEAYAGLEVLNNQYFVQMVPETLRSQWAEQAVASRRRQQSISFQVSQRLSKQLSMLQESIGSNSAEYILVEHMTRLAYALLTDDFWVCQLLLLGEKIREHSAKVDQKKLKQAIHQMHLSQMAHLEGAMLVLLMGVQQIELPFEMPKTMTILERQVDMIASSIPHGQELMEFSQGNHIFVTTKNTSGMMRNARRSARFFRYYPAESLANIFSSFAKSLSNIEE